MEINQIKAYLDNPNPQNRIKAIVELRNYPSNVVVPLLKQKMYDEKFMIRSFVAMGLGYKLTDEGFEILLKLIENDLDPNVKAEAANSLAKHGEKAIPHLLELFKRESHWLIRQSIFAALDEIGSPNVFIQLSKWGLEGDDLTVKLASISYLRKLKGTPVEPEAINLLLELSTSEIVAIRAQVARVLGIFESPKAKEALAQLREDPDHRVVGATLEVLF
ncbi:HEAT repeat domain-containing protein [Crocosphaera sp. Alani8]|uniref:HEAT repeat domain-containing protein n=1 Tax=Crocosphaera sp. Alani8 TaxID=3038952 RepID=UPI00313B33CE